MKVTRNVVAGVLAGLLLTGGTAWAVASNQPAPEVVASESVVETVSPRAETDEHREAPVKVEPTVEPVVPPAPVEAAPATVEPAPFVAAPAPVAAPVAPPAPAPAPVAIKCPAGSTSNGSDGFNDTSCYPDVCFTIVVPNPAHPECDAPFRP